MTSRWWWDGPGRRTRAAAGGSIMSGSLTIAAAAAALVAGVSPSTAYTAADGAPPPPGSVTIDIATVNGSGCAQGVARVALSGDNTAFTLSSGSFTVRLGGGAQPTDRRKNCQVNLAVQVPQGYTYAVAGADLDGSANLAKGVTGTVRSDTYFQGGSATVTRSMRIVGPYNDGWQLSGNSDPADLLYAPCGGPRNLNINTSLQVDPGTADPAMAVGSLTLGDPFDGADTVHRLVWKRCPGS
ncbi:hypothetical protein CTZ27_36075 [Streptomyces griseocarneus]|nr:hypothetical protein CTZ27_36075 [Streptomyces griseocarneus]